MAKLYTHEKFQNHEIANNNIRENLEFVHSQVYHQFSNVPFTLSNSNLEPFLHHPR